MNRNLYGLFAFLGLSLIIFFACSNTPQPMHYDQPQHISPEPPLKIFYVFVSKDAETLEAYLNDLDSKAVRQNRHIEDVQYWFTLVSSLSDRYEYTALVRISH